MGQFNQNRMLSSGVPARSNRAARRACAKSGHQWKRYGDASVRCAECGEGDSDE